MDSETGEKKEVRVSILQQAYTLRTAGDPKDIEELARSLDELMNSIARRSPNLDSTRVAVLACLHVADRLRAIENDLAALRDRVEERARRFSALLDELLASNPGSK